MEEVVAEDLAVGLMEAEMMIRRTRMRLEVAVKTRGVTIQITSMIRIIQIREEEEEGKELGEEVFVENVFIATKKGINHLNVLSTKEGMTEEMNGRLGLQLLMKMQNCHILKMLKEDKSQLIEEFC